MPTLFKTTLLGAAEPGSSVTGTVEQTAQKVLGVDVSELTPMIADYGVRALGALALLFAAWIVAAVLGRMVGNSLRKARFDETLTRFFAKMTKWLVLLLAVLMCLSLFGVETTSFAAVIGATGLAIGLALQGTLGNFASGVMLLVFRPYKVDDVVNVAGTLGKVWEIGLFTTSIDTFDNRRFIIPNGSVFGSVIENISHHPIRRADVSVGVGYAADIDKTREVLQNAAADVPGGLKDSVAAVVLVELGGSSVDWQVRVWCNTAEFWDVKQATTRAVKIALDEAGIDIPFPQLDVHLDQPSGS